MDKPRVRTFLILLALYLVIYAVYAGWLDMFMQSSKERSGGKDEWNEIMQNDRISDPARSRLLTQRPIFNSLWFVNEQTVYAVDDNELYRSTDGGKNWQPLIELHERGEWVQFDRSGMRGYAGSSSLLSVTEDGGEHWRIVDPAVIFHELTGKQLHDVMDNWLSSIWLNLDSGEGAFSAGCSHFTTTDLGQHWTLHNIEREPGKKLCIADSPFALSLDDGLAVATRIGGDTLYKRQDDKHWQAICDFDEVSGILHKLPYCPEMNQPQMTGFLSRFMSNRELPPYDFQSFDLGVLNTPMASEQLKDVTLQDNGQRQWLSFRGQLAIKVNKNTGQTWEVSANSPSLEQLYPLSDHEALGIDDYGAYFTSDAGRTWQPLGAPAHGIFMHWYQAKHNRLWATSSGELWVIDARPGAIWRKTSTPYLADEFAPINHDVNGEILWIMSNEPVLLLSRDGGDTWTTLEFKVDGELDYDHGIVTAHCHNSPPGCFLLTADGNLLSVNLATKAPQIAEKPVARMTEHEPGTIEWMAAYGDNIAAYDGYDERILLKEQGGTAWKELPLPKHNNAIHKVSSDGGFVATSQDALDRAYLHIGHVFGESWSTLRLKGWEGQVRLLCADDKLENMLIGEDGDGVAFSNDGGKHWEVMDTTDPFCGIANGYMWIRDSDFRIYALD